MDVFVEQLRKRTVELNLANVDVARRIGLNDRTYAHYAAGRREPNLQTLLKIAGALDTSPNYLLGIGDSKKPEKTEKERLVSKAMAILKTLDIKRLGLAVGMLRVIEADKLASRKK